MDRKGRVHLRVTEKEKAEFTAKAAAAGVALSEYLRKAALQIGVVHRYDQAAVHQFRKIGVNLNQIAHYLNSGNAPEGDALVALRRCLVKLEKELDIKVWFPASTGSRGGARGCGMSSFCKITIGKTPGATGRTRCTSPGQALVRFGKRAMFRTRNT